MLGVVASSGSLNPGPSSPAVGPQPGVPPRLRDVAATLPFARSTRSWSWVPETHTGCGHSWSQRVPPRRCCLQQHLHSGLALNTCTSSQIHSSPWAGRARRSLVQARTHTPPKNHCPDRRPSWSPHESPVVLVAKILVHSHIWDRGWDYAETANKFNEKIRPTTAIRSDKHNDCPHC